MTVPFPRTVPEDAPGPPSPLLDQRAARVFFADRRRAGAIGYRFDVEGVVITHVDSAESRYSWAAVIAFVRDLYGRHTGPYADEPGTTDEDEDDDPSRRERRQERRQERRDERGGR